jgi:spoIIIJ-associated protein
MSNQIDGSRFKGKTVDDAITAGLAQLGLPLENVNVKIIREGTRGLLGLGAEEAIVEMTPKEQPAAAEPEESFIASEPEIVPASDELTKAAVESLSSLLLKIGVQAKVIARRGTDLAEEGDDIPLVLDITGNDLGVLIGRRGETLRALQYMTRLMVNKQMELTQSIMVDVESYRSRRRRQLRQLAFRMAERVAYNKQRVVLEAMPPSERRVIHIALREHPAVTTRSVGEGNQRKVTILPK